MKIKSSDILNTAVKVAEKIGFQNVRQQLIADEHGCSYGTVYYYFNTITQMRRSIMRAAIEREILSIIAEGVITKDKIALKASQDLKKRAILSMVV